MGDWCRQDGHCKLKENTAKEEMGMTLLICLVYSDTNDGRGETNSSYGRSGLIS